MFFLQLAREHNFEAHESNCSINGVLNSWPLQLDRLTAVLSWGVAFWYLNRDGHVYLNCW